MSKQHKPPKINVAKERPDTEQMLVKVFADLNCPFCFALHERIDREQLNDRVQWCFVEHAPAFNSRAMTDEQAELLHNEYQLICQRAPDISVREPQNCVNTKLAILTLLTLEQSAPEKSDSYLKKLYRAYWQEGLDISDPQVLHDLLSQIHLDSIQISTPARQIQQEWQETWEKGDFDLRIPAMLASDNEVMLGLQHPENIRSFIFQTSQHNYMQGDTCLHRGDFNLAGLGISELAQKLHTEANGLHIRNFEQINPLISYCQNNPVDAVLLDYALDQKHRYQGIRALKEELDTGWDQPIIYISPDKKPHEEVQAFSLGASDFAQSLDNCAPLIARLKRSLTQARTVDLLRRYAVVDGLTGLINKREFEQNLEKEWRHACRYNLNLSAIMIDIDHFKDYNDNYGHCAGDDVLHQVARCLEQNLNRPKDIVARFGGEEFIVLLPDTQASGLKVVCEQLRRAIEQLNISHKVSPVLPKVTISLGGCSALPHPDQTAKQLVELADQSLYQAKEQGRNRFILNHLSRPDYIAKTDYS